MVPQTIILAKHKIKYIIITIISIVHVPLHRDKFVDGVTPVVVADAEDVVTTTRPWHRDLCDLVTVRLNYVKVSVKVNVDDGVGEFDEIGTFLRLPRVAVEAFLKQLINRTNFMQSPSTFTNTK